MPVGVGVVDAVVKAANCLVGHDDLVAFGVYVNLVVISDVDAVLIRCVYLRI